MKKKSLLFLSLCAWTLQSHLVQADTIVDAASQASQETEMSSLSNSNISVSQRTSLAVANEGTKQSKTLVAENTTVSSLQTPSSEIVGSANSMSELTNQGESIADSTTISNEVKPDQETTSSNAISVTSGVSLTKETASVASSTSSTSAGTGNTVTTPSTNVAARSTVSSSSQSTTSTQASNVVAIENVNAVNGSFDVRVSKVSSPKEIKEVYIPTWSEVNGQDDIIWYAAKRQLDGSYLINVDNAQHKKSVGKYHSHVYYLATDGSLSAIGATSAVLPELKASGKVSAVNVNQGAGSFEVKISDIVAPKGIAKVLVPTWTESGGQDDIVWHEASRQSDGSYLARINKTQHKYESGKYISHVYYRGHDGSMTAIGGTSVELPELKPTGTITIENRNDAQGTFDVRVTNVSSPHGLDKVYVPTWTESGGQDDIVWHEASRQSDGSYLARINKTQHKYESGKYISHVYYRGHDGSMTAIGGASVELPELKPTGTITIENRNDAQGTFDVRVTNVSSPRGLDKVYVPTWTESGGQDDIVWHEASRQSDGSYLARINKTQHKYESGKYISHVYYRGHDGSMTAIGGASVELPESKLSGTITVSDVNGQAGSFNVRITNISSPRGLDKVYVPTWTESGGQDDIVWHEASRQSDGSYLARINKNQHKYSSGKYISHVYYRGTDGSMTAVGGTSVELPSTRSYTVYIDPGHGGRDSGASYGGVHEKNLALSVSNKLRENLLKYGINVLMTRTGDYDVDFKTERSRMTNASNADLFISIHFNATGAGVSNATGIETYWYQYDPEYQPKINKEMHNNPTRLAESEILANKVQESLIKETGAVNRGVRRETFAVLRETAIPAILVELGFMDNPSELQVIKQDSYHTRLAKALAQGVMNWYGAVEGK
ncbi:GBS Bsp-like repeat-containing protein [Streptococcus suis]|uniref:GBS Bsp-like repeat-containing protein n=10 Tax=Streptococcus suis TaxID=1307 RepID=UPI001C96744A|nr:GBS Bsp-like repeat-containing protein [Streptococcus suis]MBY4968927.1 GBS Bsp-like repeat-containing protein [Streptococcus suis]MBY4995091.1 GBS Bsp-like repeat-containing protein [Streptococcus suis]MBY4997380.1 GBS Bsp-like repeat-containing protein [Streptococcus suis]MBY5004010.1 GBS Bsp-like repeat-containing protein [Streptococcus suis]HEL1959638.1 GBS Bsp-like repeat-containing protein [Streptococcus suis]